MSIINLSCIELNWDEFGLDFGWSKSRMVNFCKNSEFKWQNNISTLNIILVKIVNLQIVFLAQKAKIQKLHSGKKIYIGNNFNTKFQTRISILHFYFVGYMGFLIIHTWFFYTCAYMFGKWEKNMAWIHSSVFGWKCLEFMVVGEGGGGYIKK